MSNKWVKVVDPVTGKTRFTNKPLPDEVLYQKPINTTAKDPNKLYCADCDKEIDNRMIHVMNKNYHADCFSCTSCSRQFEMNTLAYTINDDDNKPYCRQCMTHIDNDKGVNKNREYLDATSHLVGDPTYVETYIGLSEKKYGNDDVKPLADVLNDKMQINQPQKLCVNCNQVVDGQVIETSMGCYHNSCFKCDYCKQEINTSDKFKYHNNKPMHGDCYLKSTSSPEKVCGKCGEQANGKFYNVKGTRYHIPCYICVICSKSLEGGFLQVDSNLFCSSACKKNFLNSN